MMDLDNITLARNGRALINDLTFGFQRGQITAILGPNGAGKTTLLEALVGQMPLARGHVNLDGTKLSALSRPQRARAIGYLAQDRSISWPLRVEDLVGLGRLPHGGGSPDDRTAVEAALMVMDVARFRSRSVAALSGGEQARVLMARVLAGRHDVILADEPGAALDPKHHLALFRALRAEAKRGVAVILALHDLTAAAHFADDVLLLMGDGTFVVGPPETALTPETLARAFGLPHHVAVVAGRRIILAADDQADATNREPPAP